MKKLSNSYVERLHSLQQNQVKKGRKNIKHALSLDDTSALLWKWLQMSKMRDASDAIKS